MLTEPELVAHPRFEPPAVGRVTTSAIKQVLHTVGVRMLTLACRFALVVLITRTLSTAEYGAYSIVSTIGAFGVFLCGLNLSTYVYRAVPGQPEAAQLKIFKTTFLFETGLASVVVLVFLASGELTTVLRYLNADAYRSSFVLGVVMLVLLVAIAEITTFFQAQARLERSNWVDFLAQAAWILPLLLFRWGGVSMSLNRLLLAQMAGGVGAIIYAARHIGFNAWRRIGPEWSVVKTGLAFSLPLIVPTIGVSSVRLGDRLILAHYESVADVGVYALAAVFINTLYSFTAGIMSVTFGPRIFAAHNRGDMVTRDMLQTYMLKAALIGFVIPYIGLCLGAKALIVMLARPDYIRAAAVIPLLGLSSIVLIIGYPANFLLTLQNRVVLLAGLDVAGMAVGLTANFLLIPRYSYFGAAAAGVLGLATTATLQYACSGMVRRFQPALIFSIDTELSMIRQVARRVREALA